MKRPQRSIPISIIISLLLCTVAYCGVSAVLSLMVPYYMINENSPLPEAFRAVGWSWAGYVVAIGAICSLSSRYKSIKKNTLTKIYFCYNFYLKSIFGSFFPLPRILYAMSSDGLIFGFFSNISQKFKTPIIATVISGLASGS